jgi:voltage-gated potassium channel Kch
VILAEKDKVEMEDALVARLRRSKKERIICRSGSPIDLHDLAMVDPARAKAVIVLAPENSDDADAAVVKTVLALAQMGGPASQPIVAEIQEHKNLEVGRLAGGERVQLLSRRTLLARILAQTSLQPGLSQAYHELLDFNGEDVLFAPMPGLSGRSFGDAQLCFDHCTLIGLRHADGRVELNPPMSTAVSGSDQIIVIARDEAQVELGQGAARLVNRAQIAKPGESETRPRRRVLILGWNRNLPLIVRELDDYLAEGSYILVAAQGLTVTPELSELAANLADSTLEFRTCDTTDRLGLESVEPATFDNVIVLSYSDQLGNDEADARTLITLLHLREMEKGGNRFSIVSEMQEEKNRALAAVTRVDDFIVSSRLTSLLLAQVAHNREVGPVFDDFFDSLGSELYLKPVARYVTPGPLHYATVVEAARHLGEVALGFLCQGKLRLNPSRLDPVALGPEDRILVLATD